jgi:enamine deaminase RidA (YjgF/YER057c/UK114 family)
MIVPSLFPPPDYAHAAVVEAGERLVFTAGAVPLDADGTLVGPGDFTAQTRQVLANLAAALHAAGSDLRHVVASTVYVVADRDEDLDEVWDVVRASELAGPAPVSSNKPDLSTVDRPATGAGGPHTSTLLGVSRLGYPGQLVEITAVATVPGTDANRAG